MRTRVLAALVLLMGFAIQATTAEAGFRFTPHEYRGDGVVYHHRYKPRFVHVTYRDYSDRYAYRYEPRGYYPYYNSGQWRPTAELRYRRYCRRQGVVLPPNYGAWGYPVRGYQHRAWHRRHHGGIWIGHW